MDRDDVVDMVLGLVVIGAVLGYTLTIVVHLVKGV